MSTTTGDVRRTRRANVGRMLLTFALVATPIAMVVFLFNDEHILNPAWHPHARLHVAQLAVIAVAVSMLGLWILWRRNGDPVAGAIAASVIAAAPSLAEFGALLVPGASPIPDPTHPNTIAVGDLDVPGNLIVFAFMLALIAVGLVLSLVDGRPIREAR